MSAANLQKLAYGRAGLLGLSGIASDMRKLRQSPAPEAALALGCFIHRAVRDIGALAARPEGLDVPVFAAAVSASGPPRSAGASAHGLALRPTRRPTPRIGR